MNYLTLFALFLKGSMFSTGGFGNIPILHADLLARGWARDQQFAEALAVGQVSPGPNGLWAVSLGYLVGGVEGGILAAVAILIPPFLVLLWERLYHRIKHHPMVEGFMRGLSLAVVGMVVVVFSRILQSGGLDVRSSGILVAAMALAATKRVPVILILAIGAAAGFLLYR